MLTAIAYLKANDDTFRTVYCTLSASVPELLQRGVSESDTTYPFPIGRRPTDLAVGNTRAEVAKYKMIIRCWSWWYLDGLGWPG